MASSTLESEVTFRERAGQIGLDKAVVDQLVTKKLGTYGKLAFAVAYSPHQADDKPLRDLLTSITGVDPPADDQLSALRRLFFESHTMALSDVRQRVESSPDPAAATRKLPTAERVSRQKEQEARLGGLVFTPETIPANCLVDSFVEMTELGILQYVKPEQCCSRAQEINSIKRDNAVSTDASGLLKLASKSNDPTCEANTELKLRAAWQRKNLAMDLAGLASFEVTEAWVMFLFNHLGREQPKGFSRVSLQQLLDTDRQMYTLAAHKTMGSLQSKPGEKKPLDATITALKDSTEVLQYLTPLPATRAHDPPKISNPPPAKHARGDKGSQKGSGKGPKGKAQVPEGCVTHDDENRPLCFAFQNGKCKFKGPAGKRCAKGYHKCYKQGCLRLKPYYLCNHQD